MKNLRSANILLLVFVVIFQSCHIYYRSPIDLSQAAESGKKIRITTPEEKLVFKKITASETGYYGLVRKNNSTFRKLKEMGIIGREKDRFYSFSLETLDIQEIQAKNYSTSTFATIGLTIVSLFVVIYTIAAITWNDNFPVWGD